MNPSLRKKQTGGIINPRILWFSVSKKSPTGIGIFSSDLIQELKGHYDKILLDDNNFKNIENPSRRDSKFKLED